MKILKTVLLVSGTRADHLESGEIRFTKADGRVQVWPAPPRDPLPVDSRLDLTAPIFEQAQRLAVTDRAACERAGQEHTSSAA